MIKTLHYCWFGGQPLPDNVKKCMESWVKFCPEFTLKRWDETNFDVQSVPFVKEAYEAKKWAFVSDYVRAKALYDEGGLYVDTDVEFLRSIDDLTDSSFIGFESLKIVAPGLILYAAKPKEEFYGKVLRFYENIHFDDAIKSKITSPVIYTGILAEDGLIQNNSLQKVGGMTVYPMEYFQPLGDKSCGIKKQFTENTRTIHHYDASWLIKTDKIYFDLIRRYGKFGGRTIFIFRHPVAALKKLFKCK